MQRSMTLSTNQNHVQVVEKRLMGPVKTKDNNMKTNKKNHKTRSDLFNIPRETDDDRDHPSSSFIHPTVTCGQPFLQFELLLNLFNLLFLRCPRSVWFCGPAVRFTVTIYTSAFPLNSSFAI